MSDSRDSIAFGLFECLETVVSFMENTAEKSNETTLETEESRDKKGQKESPCEVMAKKRMRLRELFEKDLLEQESLLRDLGYAFVRTHP